jgi:two-component system response regulator FixJ
MIRPQRRSFMPAQPLVHVIDDDEGVRESLAFLLATADFEVRTYDSARGFLDRLAGAPAGCIITDVRMPEMSGIDLLAALRAMGSSVPVIVITGHGDVALAVEAMKAGASDFIEKPFDDEVLVDAVAAALRREQKEGRREAERAAARNKILALSNRERQVLDGLVAGQANKAIALTLGISPRTVEVYRANLMTKMQAASLSDLVRDALSAELGRLSSEAAD